MKWSDHDRSSKIRSATKALTWRVIGTLDTAIIAWVLTGSWEIGATMGVLESISGLVLYYLHERAWAHIYLRNGNGGA